MYKAHSRTRDFPRCEAAGFLVACGATDRAGCREAMGHSGAAGHCGRYRRFDRGAETEAQVYALTGLGVVMQPDGGYTVPGWCSWLPFSSFNDACKLPTTAQVRSNDMSNLGGHADPARVATLQQQWAQADAASCAENPELCRQVAYAQENPNASALIGPAAGLAVGGVVDSVTGAVGSMNWAVIALAVGVGVFALVAVGAGSPRRYGR
jgi:hypothetical protein